MRIVPESDYPLDKIITYFESYMFMTTDRFVAKHDFFPEHPFFVFGEGVKEAYALNHIDSRKKALKHFNDCMKERVGRFPTGADVGCFIIYLEVENSKEDDDEHYFDVYEQLAAVVEKFSAEKERVVAMLPHFHQGDDVPHIHFLYQRKKREHDVLQNYMVEHFK